MGIYIPRSARSRRPPRRCAPALGALSRTPSGGGRCLRCGIWVAARPLAGAHHLAGVAARVRHHHDSAARRRRPPPGAGLRRPVQRRERARRCSRGGDGGPGGKSGLGLCRAAHRRAGARENLASASAAVSLTCVVTNIETLKPEDRRPLTALGDPLRNMPSSSSTARASAASRLARCSSSCVVDERRAVARLGLFRLAFRFKKAAARGRLSPMARWDGPLGDGAVPAVHRRCRPAPGLCALLVSRRGDRGHPPSSALWCRLFATLSGAAPGLSQASYDRRRFGTAQVWGQHLVWQARRRGTDDECAAGGVARAS